MMNAERVQSEIQRVIGDDPTIAEPTHIVVSVEKKGFWFMGKEVVVLRGSVHSETDRNKAEKIKNTLFIADIGLNCGLHFMTGISSLCENWALRPE